MVKEISYYAFSGEICATYFRMHLSTPVATRNYERLRMQNRDYAPVSMDSLRLAGKSLSLDASRMSIW